MLAGYQLVPCEASLDRGRRLLVDASARGGGRLDLRAHELFVATAWWTAHLALKLEADRKSFFGGGLPFVYLIQDDEAFFYARGSRSSLAEATYRAAREAFVVINSEELFLAILAKYDFNAAWGLPYEIDAQVSAALCEKPRERLLLVYGRPSVSRNAFEIVCDGLYLWQQRDPNRAHRWRILFLGEDFPDGLLHPIQNATVVGKASLEDYGALLSRASVGVSLMLSPHPSYPPLEMAEAGLLTISNAFEGRNPTRRFDNILTLTTLDPQSLVDAIEQAVAAAEPMIGKLVPRVPPRAPDLQGARLEIGALARELRRLREPSRA
jgi:hypothetical protein